MINRQRMTEGFKILAAFDSESFHEKDIAEYLFGKLTELGLKVHRDDPGAFTDSADAVGNIYAFLKGNTDGESILFAAHMDTVAPGKGKRPVICDDGRVTGDGTTVLGADDITGIVSILELLTVIKEDELPHPDIEVVFFAAEEPYCRGSAAFDFSLIKSKQAYILDLEGPVGRAANRAPSIVQFTAEVRGRSAHAGFEPEKGISAIVAASRAIAALKLGRVDGQTTANIGLFNGGTGKNIVPGNALVSGEVRSLSHERALEVVKEIGECFSREAAVEGAEVVFKTEEMIRAYHVPENAEAVQRYKRAVISLGFGEPELVTTFGGSDNNSFNLHDIPGIVISNAMNRVHTTEEYFYLDELVKSAEILLALIRA
jgi:tripeptide aminopeptidase